MAKINHNNSLDTIDELFTDAKNKGIMHLVTNIENMSDRELIINDKILINFGTCGYLGLELDERLKKAAADYVYRYGTQFSVSRAYVTSGINIELENKLSKMYNNSPVIVYSSTSTAHISIIPTLIKHDDVVILDQQVHMSVQTAVQLLRQKGNVIEMIRHSNIEMLERLLQQLCKKHQKVWYMIDGVYSMFGDLAPIDNLIYLMEKYEQLNLYVDDAHGMSWMGKNGVGFLFSKVKSTERIILVSTLAKGFGAMGGFAVFPDEETCRKVRVFGGPLGYSHPLAPPIIGAASASANIHLSSEIYTLQKELNERIAYCNSILSNTDLTVVSNPSTPIYFIGMGQPKVGYNMVNRLLNEGFFVNPAIFPAVPIKNTGVRFTITRHVQLADIKQLVDAVVYHYPKALADEGRTNSDVKKSFKISQDTTLKKIETTLNSRVSDNFTMQYEKSIDNIGKSDWDKLLADKGSFDWNGLKSIEESFKGNEKPEDNWEFHYFIVRDSHKEPIIATFFTLGIFKDDMLALEFVSREIEERRKKEPYYLTSKILMMGSLLTEGEHCYINRENSLWKVALMQLLEFVYKIQEETGANAILLRDFLKSDIELKSFLTNEGFFTINMPNTNVITNMEWKDEHELLKSLTKRNRKHVRHDVFNNEHMFEIKFKDIVTDEESEKYYLLYEQVAKKNKGFNMFMYPKNIIKKLSEHNGWEFMEITLRKEFSGTSNDTIVAAGWCYVREKHICPMIIGLDYSLNTEFKIYKQAIYQVLKYARSKDIETVYLGLSADFEKRKYCATQIEKVAFMQTRDNYNMEVIEALAISLYES